MDKKKPRSIWTRSVVSYGGRHAVLITATQEPQASKTDLPREDATRTFSPFGLQYNSQIICLYKAHSNYSTLIYPKDPPIVPYPLATLKCSHA